MVLPPSFYSRNTLTVAKQLLGKYLVFRPTPRRRLVGKIVETEAYRGVADKACHASWRRRKSCEVLWGRPGYAYVYFTYGMYNMLNVVTEKDGFPAAVLIRAIEPVEGVERMINNRGHVHTSRSIGSGSACPASTFSRPSSVASDGTLEKSVPTRLRLCPIDAYLHFLTSGPGKLTQALGINNKKHNGLDVTNGQILWIEDLGDKVKPSNVVVSTRIGVGYAGDWANKPWRFYVRDNPFVSRK